MTLSLIFIVKVDGVIEIPPYELFLVNNSKYMDICSILQDIATQNMHDLEFDVSRTLKFKVIGATRKLTYGFLLINNSKYMPIDSTLGDIATQNMYDLEVDLSS